MTEKVFRYVRNHEVEAWRRRGWLVHSALQGTNHGEYSTLMEAPKVERIDAGVIMARAETIVAGDRHEKYGDKLTNHGNIAVLWNAYLRIRGFADNNSNFIEPDDVAIMMALLKIARTCGGTEFVMDNYVDGAGYMACAGEIAHRLGGGQ